MALTFKGGIQLIAKQSLSVTENGAYNAPSGKAFDPVVVAVPAEEQLRELISGRLSGHFDIPAGIPYIKNYAFSDCSITDITIPNSVTSIGKGAFAECYSLTSVTIPNSVTLIRARAFYDCRSLTSITIPNSVTGLDVTAFSQCTNLATITCDFAEGTRGGAPWGAPNAQVVYLR